MDIGLRARLPGVARFLNAIGADPMSKVFRAWLRMGRPLLPGVWPWGGISRTSYNPRTPGEWTNRPSGDWLFQVVSILDRMGSRHKPRIVRRVHASGRVALALVIADDTGLLVTQGARRVSLLSGLLGLFPLFLGVLGVRRRHLALSSFGVVPFIATLGAVGLPLRAASASSLLPGCFAIGMIHVKGLLSRDHDMGAHFAVPHLLVEVELFDWD